MFGHTKTLWSEKPQALAQDFITFCNKPVVLCKILCEAVSPCLMKSAILKPGCYWQSDMGNHTILPPCTWTLHSRAPIRAEDGPSLQKFSKVLTSCRNTPKEIGYLNCLVNPDSLRKIVERLPYPLRLKWCDLVDTISQKEKRDPNLKYILEFVDARSRAANHPIFGKVQSEQKPPFNSRTNTRSR